MRSLKVVLPLFLALWSSFLFADQIVLKNGDRLTGTVDKSDDKALVLKTEFEGEVTVQWSAIQQVKSEQPLHVGLKDGKTVIGPVNTTDGKIEVSTTTAGTVQAPMDTVVVMRSDAEQMAWEKLQHPGLLEGWDGGVNVGFGLTAGNSETKNLALAFTGTRTGVHDKLSLYAVPCIRPMAWRRQRRVLPPTRIRVVRVTIATLPRVCSALSMPTSSRMPCKTSICAPCSEADLVFMRSKLLPRRSTSWTASPTRARTTRTRAPAPLNPQHRRRADR